MNLMLLLINVQNRRLVNDGIAHQKQQISGKMI